MYHNIHISLSQVFHLLPPLSSILSGEYVQPVKSSGEVRSNFNKVLVSGHEIDLNCLPKSLAGSQFTQRRLFYNEIQFSIDLFQIRM